MFYKKDENTGEWHFGNEVHFPDGTKLTAENKELKDGWEWHDEPPAGFQESLNTQED